MGINSIFRITLFATILGVSSSCVMHKINNHSWHFNSLKGWETDHQDDNPSDQLKIDNGILKIYTRAQSWDRKKIRTLHKHYTTGRYFWKLYIPPMGMGDQASVGAWLYADDQHELDFEVGYGKQEIRDKLAVSKEEVLVYMASQDYPKSSEIVTIKPGWHEFEIDLAIKDQMYFVSWWIDGEIKHQLQLAYAAEIPFYIYCSVENLQFIGDHIPRQDNYGLFDFVKYRYHK